MKTTKKFMPTRLCLVGMAIAIIGIAFTVWGVIRLIGLQNAADINGMSYEQIPESGYVKGNVTDILQAKSATSSDKYFNYCYMTSDGIKGPLDETNSYIVSFDSGNSVVSFSVDKLLSPNLHSLFEEDEQSENKFVGKIRQAKYFPDLAEVKSSTELEFFFNQIDFNNLSQVSEKDIIVLNTSNYIIPLWIGLVVLIIGIWIFFLDGNPIKNYTECD